jgi:hypothetical protein
MVFTSYPNRKRARIALCALVFIGLALPIFAADPTHHFELKKTSAIFAGQETALLITAHRADGSFISEAKNDISLTLTNGRGTTEARIQMKNGEGKLTTTFNEAGFVIVQANDRDNADLTMSDMIKVLPARPAKVKTGENR